MKSALAIFFVVFAAALVAAPPKGRAPTRIDDSIYIDTTVQFTVTESGSEPDLSEGGKLAVWLGVDDRGGTNLVVAARRYDWVASGASSGGTGIVTGRASGEPARFILRPAGVGVVPTDGSKCRLTVRAWRNVFANDHHGVIPCFRIFIDGAPMKVATADNPFTQPMRVMLRHFGLPGLKTLVEDGQIFPSLEPMGKPGAEVTLSGVDFKGDDGAMEDLVVSDDPVEFEPGICFLDFLFHEPRSAVWKMLGE